MERHFSEECREFYRLGDGSTLEATPPQPVPRILLPLLLCLSLIAGAVGSVWSATVMAMPMDDMAMTMDAGHDCCHEEASLQCADDGSDATAASCADGNHCDCKQHCNMLPATAMARLGNPRSRRCHRCPCATTWPPAS